MASSIITEDNVSAHILSFSRQNFLFTRTVCKSWYKNGTQTTTHVNRAVDSTSTVDEAYRHKYPLDLYAPYIDACRNASDISVFAYLVDIGEPWIHDDAEHAAEHGRIDVLKLFRENGQVLDEKILHTAVRYGQLETLVYLMSAGCPVDNTRIEWGYGEHVIEELKMCSMEIAARDGRLDIMKQLRSNATEMTPFPHHTLEYALEGRHLEVLKYIRDASPVDVFGYFLYDAIEYEDLYEVAFLVQHGLVKYMFPHLVHAFNNGDTNTTDVFVLSMPPPAQSSVVDQALGACRDDGMFLVRYLVQERGIMPTPDAFNYLLSGRWDDDSMLSTLNWLHDDLRIRVHPESLKDLAKHSEAVQRWFHDKCRSCRINFKDGNNGVKRKWSAD